MDRAPHCDGLSDRFQSEQPADQFGTTAEGLLLWGSELLVREFRFNIFEQLWERHGERNEGSVQGGGHFGSYALACQAIASSRLASGVDNAA
jgi:hypothetical protein